MKMRWVVGFLLSVLSFSAFSLQCITYVRQHTGWADFPQTPPDHEAYRWWDTAKGSGYSTSGTPIVGAVLVWKGWEQNSAGHVAIVASIVNDERITVVHANWPIGSSGHEDVVIKADPEGAWTSVKVGPENTPHDVYGFIYPKGNPQAINLPVTCQGDSCWAPQGQQCENAAFWCTLEDTAPKIGTRNICSNLQSELYELSQNPNPRFQIKKYRLF